MGGMRGCPAGARRLLHELIDSICSWAEASDEEAMVNMLASFRQERFEVGCAILLQQPLCPVSCSIELLSAPVQRCTSCTGARCAGEGRGGGAPTTSAMSPSSVAYLAAYCVPTHMTWLWHRPKWHPLQLALSCCNRISCCSCVVCLLSWVHCGRCSNVSHQRVSCRARCRPCRRMYRCWSWRRAASTAPCTAL